MGHHDKILKQYTFCFFSLVNGFDFCLGSEDVIMFYDSVLSINTIYVNMEYIYRDKWIYIKYVEFLCI